MHYLPGNNITLLTNGEEFFPALTAAIDAAQQEVHLETYIFAYDATGVAIARALMRAARRGVAVHVLVDGFGAANFMHDYGPELEDAGVELRVFRPEVTRFRLRRHRLRRLHRKLASIDARIAFVGGINIIDDMHTPGQLPPRRDYALRIEGPLLVNIHHAMQHMWFLVSWASLRSRQSPWTQPGHLVARSTPCGPYTAAFVIRDNLRHRHDIENAYLQAIGQARREVLIANAYFLPGRRFRQALKSAAERGVRVTLLLQGRVEYRLLHYATQGLYGALLAAGIHIHEYKRGFLHAKVAVIDDDWSTVGSSNIDPFSLLLAREANVFIKSTEFADQLRGSLRQTMQQGAIEVAADHWRRQPWWTRSASWLALTLVRLLIDLAGYGKRQ